jgi:hypothetical protein
MQRIPGYYLPLKLRFCKRRDAGISTLVYYSREAITLYKFYCGKKSDGSKCYKGKMEQVFKAGNIINN